jgi:hypothetical protein
MSSGGARRTDSCHVQGHVQGRGVVQRNDLTLIESRNRLQVESISIVSLTENLFRSTFDQVRSTCVKTRRLGVDVILYKCEGCLTGASRASQPPPPPNLKQLDPPPVRKESVTCSILYELNSSPCNCFNIIAYVTCGVGSWEVHTCKCE